MKPNIIPRIAVLMTIVTSLVASSPSIAADSSQNIQEGVTRLGDAVGKWFTLEQRERLLTIAAFVSDDGEQSAEFKRVLEAQLKKLTPPFELRRADIVLSGRLSKGKGKANAADVFDSVALRVEAELHSRGAAGKLESFGINVFGDEALQFLGPTAEFPKDLPGSEPDKQKQLDKQLGTDPEAFISGNQTLGKKDGQFAVEILVRQGIGNSALPHTPVAVSGQSFVKLSPGEEYIIRLHNKSAEETAVALTIDGLSMFTFAEDGTGDSMILIPSGKSADIPGWYITSKKTDVFEVSNYAKSAAASKNLPAAGIGVITARFHVSQSAEGKGEEATKRGRQIDQDYKQERRSIGVNRAFITVRYNRDGK